MSFFFKYKLLQSLNEKEHSEELTLKEWFLVVWQGKEVYD